MDLNNLNNNNQEYPNGDSQQPVEPMNAQPYPQQDEQLSQPAPSASVQQNEAPYQAEPQAPVSTPQQQSNTEAPYSVGSYPVQTTYSAYGAGSSPNKKPKTKKSGRGLVVALCGIAGACLLFAGGAAIGSFILGGTTSVGSVTASSPSGGSPASSNLPTMTISETPSIDAENYDTVNGMAGEDIYKKANPSIVSVVSTNMETGGGSGSGVIMSQDGYIITNNHVISDAQQVSVILSDGTTLDAAIVGADSESDLAVLKANTNATLTPAEFGNSDDLEPGQYCYTIGSPGGVELANTITGGRISAINRNITINDSVMTVIQTDASINPGNSGGALINKYGQVVGITSAKLMSDYYAGTTYEGLGFAIPINSAKTIVDELIANGYISGRPSIGITGYDVTDQMTRYSNVPQGVYVASVDENAAAYKEGLQAQDIITGVNGQTITSMEEINAIKADLKAGDQIELTVYRMSTGKTLTIKVTLTDAHELEGNTSTTEDTQDNTNPYGNYGGYDNGYGSYGGNDGSNYGSYGGDNGSSAQDPFSYFFGN